MEGNSSNKEVLESTPRSCPRTYQELIDQKTAQLEKNERKFLFPNGLRQVGLAVPSAFLINTLLRRSLLLYEGVIYTNLLTILSTSIANYGLSKVFIDLRLFNGELLGCPLCVMLREGLIQAGTSTLLPLVGSIGISAILADRFKASDIPSLTWKNRKEAFTFWPAKIRGFRSTLYISFLIQGLCGAFVGYRKQEIMEKVHNSVTDEELDEILQYNIQKTRYL